LTATNQNDVTNEAKEYLKKGLEFYDKEQFDESREPFEELVHLFDKNDPPTAEIWNILGQAYHCLGNYYDALKCYDCALELAKRGNDNDKQIFDPLYFKSLTLKNMGLYHEALNSLNLFTFHDVNRFPAKNIEGLIYNELKEFDRAKKCFDTIINAEPGEVEKVDITLRPRALNNKAMTYADAEEYDEALAALDRLKDEDKEQPYILDTRAFIYFKQEKYKQALKLLEKAGLKSSKDKFIAYHRGNIYSKLGKSLQAIKYYETAINIDNNFAEAYNDKAAELSKLGRYPEAKKALEAAIRIKPGLVTAHENLIKVSFLHQHQAYPNFWEFWKTSKTKKIAGIALFSLACFLILFPILAFIIPVILDMYETHHNFSTALASITGNSKTSTLESVLPMTFLVGTAILALILLSPVLRTAKMGPLEFSFLDSQRSVQALSGSHGN
jgi:tetratricopeptide (TPR) repeat protein